MELSALFETCFVILALMLVGFFGVRRGIYPPGFSRAASWLVVNIFLVGSIFQSICSGNAGLSPKELPHVLLVVIVTILLGYVLGFLTLRLLGQRIRADASLELSIAVMNNLLIGLPILDAMYGPTAVLYVGLTSLPFNLLLYTYGTWRLGVDGGFRAKDVFSPCVVSTLAALVFFVLGLPVPKAVSRLFTVIAACSMPLSMIVSVYLIALVRLVVVPALTWLVLALLTDNELLLKSCVVIAGCPTGIVVPVLTLRSGREASLASNAVIVTTLLSLLTLPALLLILG